MVEGPRGNCGGINANIMVICFRWGFSVHSLAVLRLNREHIGTLPVGAHFKFDAAVGADTQNIVGQRYWGNDDIKQQPNQRDGGALL